MNAYIHQLDRVESARIPIQPPGRLRRALARLAEAVHASRDRRAAAYLSEWNEHLLRDVGLSVDGVRRPPQRPLSDGRWMVEHWRLRER